MKKLFLTLVAFIPLLAMAQRSLDSVTMNRVDSCVINFRNLELDQVMEIAKEEGKIIFVTLSATWCAPCKQLKATTFQEPIVGRFYNDNFVNMYINCDIQKELAKQMKNEYGYSAFPTMLYLNADGKLIHKHVGAGMKPDEFVAIAQTAIDNKGLASYHERYTNGERGTNFIKEYVAVLGSVNESDKAAKVSADFLNSLTIEDLIEQENFNMMRRNINDLDAKSVQLVLTNKDKFTNAKILKEVESYEYMVWSVKGSSFVRKGNPPMFDKTGYVAFIKRLRRSSLTDKQKAEIENNSELNNAETMGEWKRYVKLTSSALKEEVSSLVSYNWGLRVEQQCNDPKLRLAFATALEKNIKGMENTPFWGNAFTGLLNRLKKRHD